MPKPSPIPWALPRGHVPPQRPEGHHGYTQHRSSWASSFSASEISAQTCRLECLLVSKAEAALGAGPHGKSPYTSSSKVGRPCGGKMLQRWHHWPQECAQQAGSLKPESHLHGSLGLQEDR